MSIYFWISCCYISQFSVCYDKYLRKTNLKEEILGGSLFQKLQFKVSWLHCLGLGVKQNIMVIGVWWRRLLTSWHPGSKERDKWTWTVYSFHSHIPCDLFPPTRSHILTAHSTVNSLIGQWIDKVGSTIIQSSLNSAAPGGDQAFNTWDFGDILHLSHNSGTQ
jgi:hypothetical protein